MRLVSPVLTIIFAVLLLQPLTAPAQSASSSAPVAVDVATEPVQIEPPPVSAHPGSLLSLTGLATFVPDLADRAATAWSALASPSPALPASSAGALIASPTPRDPSPPEFWQPREPELIIGATIKPREDVDDEKKKTEITGTLIEEPHYLKRRKTFKRWVLRQKDGNRIPLTANLSLMFALQQVSPASGPVTLHGSWLQSKANEGLRYFTVERIQAAVPEPEVQDVPASGSADLDLEDSAEGLSEEERALACAEAEPEPEQEQDSEPGATAGAEPGAEPESDSDEDEPGKATPTPARLQKQPDPDGVTKPVRIQENLDTVPVSNSPEARAPASSPIAIETSAVSA